MKLAKEDLVELKRVKQVIDFAVLLTLGQLAVILQQSVERQLRLVVHEDFVGLLHELLTHAADLRVQRSREPGGSPSPTYRQGRILPRPKNPVAASSPQLGAACTGGDAGKNSTLANVFIFFLTH